MCHALHFSILHDSEIPEDQICCSVCVKSHEHSMNPFSIALYFCVCIHGRYFLEKCRPCGLGLSLEVV